MKKINKRRLKYGANNIILIIAAIVIFVLVNFLSAALSEKFPSTRIDLTGNGVFNIGDATKNVLAELDESGNEVHLYYMKGSSEENTYIKEIILKYLAASDNLEYEVKYFNRDPAFVQQFTSGTVTEHSLIVENATNGRFRIINASEMTDYDEQGNLSAANLESKLTNALAYCISKDDNTVCFITDHREVNPAEMANVLTNENITPTTFSLKNGEVPQDCKMLYIISPIDDFTAEEIERLDHYLDRGGSVQIAIEPFFSLPRLESYLKEWGITLGNDIVIEGDPNYRLIAEGDSIDVFYPQIEQIDLNKDLLEGGTRRNIFATLCRSVSFEQDMLGAITCDRVLRTTRYGVAINFDEPEEGQEDSGIDEAQGTYALAMYLEKTVGENYDKTARLLVAGSSSFWGASQYAEPYGFDLNGLLSEGSYGNNRFFVGSTYEMLGINSTRLTISSKSLNYSRLVMTETQQRLYRIIFCFALPIIIMIAGIIFWLRRRHL